VYCAAAGERIRAAAEVSKLYMHKIR